MFNSDFKNVLVIINNFWCKLDPCGAGNFNSRFSSEWTSQLGWVEPIIHGLLTWAVRSNHLSIYICLYNRTRVFQWTNLIINENVFCVMTVATWTRLHPCTQIRNDCRMTPGKTGDSAAENAPICIHQQCQWQLQMQRQITQPSGDFC